MVKLQKDLKEFIELLNSHDVEFLVVGGHAVGFHGHPRFTADIDFWIRPSESNASRFIRVLEGFGFPDAESIRPALSREQNMLQLGVPPNRIDVLTSVSGLEFEATWQTRVPGEIDGISIFFPDLDSLLRNKRSSGRPKDLADIDALEEVSRKS